MLAVKSNGLIKLNVKNFRVGRKILNSLLCSQFPPRVHFIHVIGWEFGAVTLSHGIIESLVRLCVPRFLATFLPGGSDSKKSACSAGDLGLIPGLRRSPREGNGYPLQYSCLENSMDRGAWRASIYGVTKSRIRLSDYHFYFPLLRNPVFKFHSLIWNI